MKILVLDDALPIRQLVKFTLEKKGSLTVDMTANVSEAIEQCKHVHNYELFIVDYMIDRETGFDFLRRLRRSPDYQNTPVMMLSGEEPKGYEHEIESFNIDGWLIKPFKPNELLAEVKKLKKKKA